MATDVNKTSNGNVSRLAENNTWLENFRLYLRSTPGLALVYFTAITVAEVVTTLVEPRVGLIMHGFVLIAILLHATLGIRGVQQGFLLTLALAPLVRLLSLSLPLIKFPFVYWYAIVGAPLFLAAFLTARVTGLSRAQMGFTLNRWFLQLLIGATGVGLGYVEYLILRPEPLSEGPALQQIWLPALILFIFTGLLEEVIFRGVMHYTALRSLGRLGILYVAAVFAVLHLGYKSVLDVLFVFGVALFFSIATIKTGSILGVTISHGLTNIGLFLVFPFAIGSAGGTVIGLPAQASPTATRTATAIFTRTPLPTLTQTAALTETPTATIQLTATRAPSATPTWTLTPLPSLVSTAVLTATEAITPTSPTPTPLPTETPTAAELTATPAITATVNPLNQTVIDDGDLGFLRSGGEQYLSPTGFGGDYIWAATVRTNMTMQVEWRPAFTSCGAFELEVFIPSGIKLTRSALYQVGHRSGLSSRIVNQSAHPGEWLSLGQYEFQATSSSFLRLTNATGEAPSPDLAIAFDAARWTYLSPCK